MKVLRNIKIVLLLFLFVAVFDMPYYYYEIMRFICMVGFIILAKFEYNKKQNIFFAIWLTVALLINPYFKLVLGREIWAFIDVFLIIILFVSIVKENKK